MEFRRMASGEPIQERANLAVHLLEVAFDFSQVPSAQDQQPDDIVDQERSFELCVAVELIHDCVGEYSQIQGG